MKKYLVCSIILVFYLFFTSCDRVVATPADELLMTDRYAQTPSGIKASLSFSEGEGELKIEFPSGEKPLCIRGVVAADEENFYITSKDFGRTYTFSYKVFSDRAEISYSGETLIFYPVENENSVP